MGPLSASGLVLLFPVSWTPAGLHSVSFHSQHCSSQGTNDPQVPNSAHVHPYLAWLSAPIGPLTTPSFLSVTLPVVSMTLWFCPSQSTSLLSGTSLVSCEHSSFLSLLCRFLSLLGHCSLGFSPNSLSHQSAFCIT